MLLRVSGIASIVRLNAGDGDGEELQMALHQRGFICGGDIDEPVVLERDSYVAFETSSDLFLLLAARIEPQKVAEIAEEVGFAEPECLTPEQFTRLLPAI